jgi:hypothetical protein
MQHRRRRRTAPEPAARLLQTGPAASSRRSTVFVVSDFISEPGWEKPLAQLAQRHEVVAVRLFDPLEMELPDLGLVTVRDAETGEQLLVDTTTKAFASASPPSPRSARPTCAAPGARRRGHAGAVHRRRPGRRPRCASPTCAASARGGTGGALPRHLPRLTA